MVFSKHTGKLPNELRNKQILVKNNTIHFFHIMTLKMKNEKNFLYESTWWNEKRYSFKEGNLKIYCDITLKILSVMGENYTQASSKLRVMVLHEGKIKVNNNLSFNWSSLPGKGCTTKCIEVIFE